MPSVETPEVGGGVTSLAAGCPAGYVQSTVAAAGAGTGGSVPNLDRSSDCSAALVGAAFDEVPVDVPPESDESEQPARRTARLTPATRIEVRFIGPSSHETQSIRTDVMSMGRLGLPPPACIDPSSPAAATFSMVARPVSSTFPNAVYCGGSCESA